MSRVKNAALLTLNLFTLTDTPIVLRVKHIFHPMINLDYYDQLQTKECYCEDTLFAFGSEDYLNPPVQNTGFTETETSCASIITMLQEYAVA